MTRILLLLDLLLTGLVAGTVFGIFIGYNPSGLSQLAYLEQHQNVISGLNALIPIMGFVAVIISLILAFIYRKSLRAMSGLAIAAVLLIAGGLITQFGNQPINAMISEWSINQTPDNWMELRDEWWKFHAFRTITSVLSFGFVAWVATLPKDVTKNISRIE